MACRAHGRYSHPRAGSSIEHAPRRYCSGCSVRSSLILVRVSLGNEKRHDTGGCDTRTELRFVPPKAPSSFTNTVHACSRTWDSPVCGTYWTDFVSLPLAERRQQCKCPEKLIYKTSSGVAVILLPDRYFFGLRKAVFSTSLCQS